MKRVIECMCASIILLVFVAGCAFTSSFDQDKRVMVADFRVGVEELTVVHGKVQIPTQDVSIVIGSDLAVLAIDATVGGGILRSVVEGIQAAHVWLWGKG